MNTISVIEDIIEVSLDSGSYPPVRAHENDAGLDLRTPRSFMLKAHSREQVDTGVHVQIPEGSAGILMSKSGLNVKHGITSTGLIDAGFSGQIAVELYNHSDEDYVFFSGDKISQLVIVPVFLFRPKIVASIKEGERGDAGFGSTGR